MGNADLHDQGPDDWNDVAMRSDVEALRTETHQKLDHIVNMTSLRFNHVDSTLDHRFSRMEAQFDLQVERLRTDLKDDIHAVNDKLIGMSAALDQQSARSDSLAGELSGSQREMGVRFGSVDQAFTSLRREMNVRFDSVDQDFTNLRREMDDRFDSVDQDFISLRREVDVRFTTVDERFDATNKLIGSSMKDAVRAQTLRLVVLFVAMVSAMPVVMSLTS